jgi:hypothetical protein
VALTVEDGTGLADADSYISLVDALAYHTARSNSAWALLANDTLRESYLRRAVDYMQQQYFSRWAGYRKTTTQALDWPRYEVPIKDSPGSYGYTVGFGSYYSSDSVPTLVANACAELALRASTGELSPDLERAIRREKVGPIDTEYEPGSIQSTRFEAVDNMLRPFFKATGMFLPVTRV